MVFVLFVFGFSILDFVTGFFKHMAYGAESTAYFVLCNLSPATRTRSNLPTRTPSHIKLSSYLKNLGCRQIENVVDTGFFSDLFQIDIYLFH